MKSSEGVQNTPVPGPLSVCLGNIMIPFLKTKLKALRDRVPYSLNIACLPTDPCVQGMLLRGRGHYYDKLSAWRVEAGL